MDRLIRAAVNTYEGLLYVIRTETSFQQELVLLLLAVLGTLFATEDPWKRAFLVGSVLFTMVVELLNTSLEKLADRITLNYDPQIEKVKNMGSAAVGLSLLGILASWLLVLGEWLR
jgi:diacylglycerol kinase (ATP)